MKGKMINILLLLITTLRCFCSFVESSYTRSCTAHSVLILCKTNFPPNDACAVLVLVSILVFYFFPISYFIKKMVGFSCSLKTRRESKLINRYSLSSYCIQGLYEVLKMWMIGEWIENELQMFEEPIEIAKIGSQDN